MKSSLLSPKTLRGLLPGALLTACLLGFVSPAHAVEPVTVESIRSTIAEGILSEDFAALDALEVQLRTSKVKNESGWWYLSHFYSEMLYPPAWTSKDETTMQRREAFFQRWNKAMPQSLAAPVLLGRAYLYHAGVLRGTRASREVTPQQWAGYEKYQALATAAFSQNMNAQAEKNPAWHTAILSNVNGSEPDGFVDAFLERSLRVAPDYPETFIKVADVTQPRWGGSARLLEARAQLALKYGGPEAYAVMYTQAFAFDPCNCSYRLSELKPNWDVYVQGMKSRIQRYPRSGSANMLVAISCNTGHRETYQEGVLSMMQTEGVNLHVWRTFNHNRDCLRWAQDSYNSMNHGKQDNGVPRQ